VRTIVRHRVKYKRFVGDPAKRGTGISPLVLRHSLRAVAFKVMSILIVKPVVH
jgi:hypothetical protein